MPIYNPYALGNAWFVDEVQYANNANEEIEAIHHLNPATTAVVDKKFAEEVKVVKESVSDSTRSIVLKEYQPNTLTYEVKSSKGGTVVFSEIYYPGWQSFIDGEEVAHGRANYILRAMNVPAGTHTVTFIFDPKSLHMTETIAFIAMGLLLAGALVVLFLFIRRQKQIRI